MKTLTNFKTWSVRAKNATVALLFLATYTISMVAPFIPVQTASALDTGWVTPGAAVSPNNWDVSTVANVQASDDTYISENDGQMQGYSSFGLPSITSGSTINGIEVKVEAKSTDTSGCRLGVALSWDGGTSLTSSKYADLTGSDASTTLGGTADTWGHTWSTTELTNATFVLRVEDNDPGSSCDNAVSTTTYVDQVQVRVTYTAPVAPVANPALSQACGLDIALVIDNSTSIDSTEMTQMKTALTSFTNALASTPTQFSVTRFATSAAVVQSFTNDVTAVNAAINAVPVGGGYTNWEDGFTKAASTLPNRSNPNLVIFATDGDPTTSNTVGGTDTSQPNAHLKPAIVAANAIKTSGTRILMLGIGLGSDSGSVSRLKQVSGPNADTGSVLTSDVITTDFSALATALATFAQQTCGGTITTEKVIDADGDPATTADQTPAAGWEFDINGGSNPAATTTDSDGLTPAVKVDAATGYSVNETPQATYNLIAASCTGASNNGTWSGNAVTGIQISASNIVRCKFVNTLKKGGVQLVKVVKNDNGGTLGVNNFGLSIGGTTVTSGQTLSLPVGTPVVITEAGATGYSFVSISGTGCPDSLGGTVTPVEGQTITCTITNDDQPATLIVNKIVKNDNGGSKQATDFSYKVNGGSSVVFEADGSNSHTLNAGTYSIVENADSGYTTTYSNCTGLVLGIGSTATCTITNDDKSATITLNKTVVNHYGGTKTPADFTPSLSGTGAPASVLWSTPVIVNAGTYTAGESTLGGYASQGWTGDCATNGAVTVTNGQSKTCAITNADLPASLSGKKIIGNTDLSWVTAGSNPAAGWTIYLDQNQNGVLDAGETNTVTDTNGNYSFTGLSASVSYYVKEIIPTLSGWEQITGVANPVVISSVGGSSTGNNFTNKAHGSITVIKQLEPASDTGEFNLLVGGQTKAANVGDDGTTGKLTVDAGTYSIAETAGTSTNLSDYNSEWNCSIGLRGASDQGTTTTATVGPGEDWICTFTNTRKTSTVKVIKDVTNDNGGTKTAANDFTFTNNGGTPQTFTATTNPDGERVLTLPVGSTFSISEPEANTGGYTTTYSGACSGTVTEQQKVCTITNDDQPATLIVKKHVVNDNGGQITASQFTLNVTGSNVGISSFAGSESGVTTTLNAGSYSVDETPDPGYTKSLGSDCSGTVKNGETKTCTVTNDDKAPSLTLVKHVTNNNGGGKAAADWMLSAVGPTSISGPGGAVSDANFARGTYTLGETTIANYHVGSDWSCSPVANNGTSITLGLGQSTTCEITNDDDPASLSGTKTIANTDLSWATDGKPPVSGWVIYLDQNQNGVLDQDEQSTTTDANGNYSFDNLVAGMDYYVKEVVSTLGGWVQISTPSTVNITELGGISEGNNFSNQAQGKLTVVKNVDDGYGNTSEDVSNWTWSYDGADADKSGIATGSDNGQTVPAGTYTVREDQKTGYHVTASNCTESTAYSKASLPVAPSETQTVLVGLGGNITCTFTNTRDMGDLTIVKDALPDSMQPFEFTVEPVNVDEEGGTITGIDENRFGEGTAPAPFDLIDSSPAAETRQNTLSLPTGWYAVTETGVTGWDMTDLDCDDVNWFKSDDGQLAIYIGKGYSLECTFTNTQRAQLSVVKDVQPDSTKAFSFSTNIAQDELGADLSFSLTDDGSSTGTNVRKFENILPGTYTITEDQLDGWKLDDIVCTGKGVGMTRNGAILTVTLAAGAVASCTFVNSFIPQVLAETYSLPTLVDTGSSIWRVLGLATTILMIATGLTLYRRRETTI